MFDLKNRKDRRTALDMITQVVHPEDKKTVTLVERITRQEEHYQQVRIECIRNFFRELKGV